VDTMASAIQDLYPDDYARCYGCGRLNAHGLHVRTFWERARAGAGAGAGAHAGAGAGVEAGAQIGVGTARFTPRAEHIAMPGFVYGGLLASLIDCHGIGTAAAAAMEADGHVPGRDASPRFVTASLRVDFLKPTPAGQELVLTARPRDVGPRKVQVDVELAAGGQVTARGEVLAVRLPETFRAR
jgi:acyl-coenzyme A thioesterase PaaI-like protein